MLRHLRRTTHLVDKQWRLAQHSTPQHSRRQHSMQAKAIQRNMLANKACPLASTAVQCRAEKRRATNARRALGPLQHCSLGFATQMQRHGMNSSGHPVSVQCHFPFADTLQLLSTTLQDPKRLAANQTAMLLIATKVTLQGNFPQVIFLLEATKCCCNLHIK